MQQHGGWGGGGCMSIPEPRHTAAVGEYGHRDGTTLPDRIASTPRLAVADRDLRGSLRCHEAKNPPLWPSQWTVEAVDIHEVPHPCPSARRTHGGGHNTAGTTGTSAGLGSLGETARAPGSSGPRGTGIRRATAVLQRCVGTLGSARPTDPANAAAMPQLRDAHARPPPHPPLPDMLRMPSTAGGCWPQPPLLPCEWLHTAGASRGGN